jgi:hypothetical protein
MLFCLFLVQRAQVGGVGTGVVHTITRENDVCAQKSTERVS